MSSILTISTTPIVVIDASCVLTLALLDEPYAPEALRLFEHLNRVNARLTAPPLLELECDSAIRRHEYLGHMTSTNAANAFLVVDALSIEIVHDARVRTRAREIGSILNTIRLYDVTYAALAELTGCDMWTADERFFNTASRQFPLVRFVGTIPPVS